jgi:uncharacterized membrane protein
MFIAFIPFSTALIGEYGDQQISVIIYGINIITVLHQRSGYAQADTARSTSDNGYLFVGGISTVVLVFQINEKKYFSR